MEFMALGMGEDSGQEKTAGKPGQAGAKPSDLPFKLPKGLKLPSGD